MATRSSRRMIEYIAVHTGVVIVLALLGVI